MKAHQWYYKSETRNRKKPDGDRISFQTQFPEASLATQDKKGELGLWD